MARARSATATPGQLTLDDWAETLKGDRAATETLRQQAPIVIGPSSVGIAATTEARRAADTGRSTERSVRHHPLPTELLAVPEALLTRTQLRELGLERRAVDAVFRALPVVSLPGYSRPMVRVDHYLELVKSNTFRDDRVRPMARAP